MCAPERVSGRIGTSVARGSGGTVCVVKIGPFCVYRYSVVYRKRCFYVSYHLIVPWLRQVVKPRTLLASIAKVQCFSTV